MKDKILIVDDDQAILTLLQKSLKQNGFNSDLANNGELALTLAKQNSYALILLDINMSGINGFEVIKQIRDVQLSKVPIMIVSGRKEDKDALYGLDIGADDYVTKPFNPVTLVAKVKALIRRNKALGNDDNNIIVAGPFKYNSSTLRFFKNNKEISLSGKENALIKLFLDNTNHIFSKEMLYSEVWNESIVDENTIMVYINRIRQKIEDDPSEPKYLLTIRGLGYKFTVS